MVDDIKSWVRSNISLLTIGTSFLSFIGILTFYLRLYFPDTLHPEIHSFIESYIVLALFGLLALVFILFTIALVYD